MSIQTSALDTLRSLRSLAYRTDLSILAFKGRLEERADYFVAESPQNPTYFWGNLLVMKRPPQQGDYEKWIKHFEMEFRHQPLIKHMTFGWDSTDASDGEAKTFLENGFEFERSVVLTMTQDQLVTPKHAVARLVIRPLHSDEDWEAAIHNQVASELKDFKLESYVPFKRAQFQKYRAMAESGLGKWFGAFVDDRLVADCGVYEFDGIARYQAVGTHPEFRRRGICGNLVYETAKYAYENLMASKLVMVADPEYHAAKVYESVGFKPTEKSIGLCRYPKKEWTT